MYVAVQCLRWCWLLNKRGLGFQGLSVRWESAVESVLGVVSDKQSVQCEAAVNVILPLLPSLPFLPFLPVLPILSMFPFLPLLPIFLLLVWQILPFLHVWMVLVRS